LKNQVMMSGRAVSGQIAPVYSDGQIHQVHVVLGN
jgi:hypothetical protein